MVSANLGNICRPKIIQRLAQTAKVRLMRGGHYKLFAAGIKIFSDRWRSAARVLGLLRKSGANFGGAFSRFWSGFSPQCRGVLTWANLRAHFVPVASRRERSPEGVISHAHFQAWGTLRAREKVRKLPLFFVTEFGSVPSVGNSQITRILRLFSQVFRSADCDGLGVTRAGALDPFSERGFAG
jgi:hypothetical protein